MGFFVTRGDLLRHVLSLFIIAINLILLVASIVITPMLIRGCVAVRFLDRRSPGFVICLDVEQGGRTKGPS